MSLDIPDQLRKTVIADGNEILAVMAADGVGHDVVHRSPEALQQQGLPTRVLAQEPGASPSVGKAQRHGLLPDVPAWHTDLEDCRWTSCQAWSNRWPGSGL